MINNSLNFKHNLNIIILRFYQLTLAYRIYSVNVYFNFYSGNKIIDTGLCSYGEFYEKLKAFRIKFAIRTESSG